MKAARTPRFEEIEAGFEITNLVKGPLTTMHLMRWSASIELWHRIHYDRPFAQEHDHLPDLLVNGSFKQQVLMQMLKDWAGPEGWPWKSSFQFRAMNKVGETLTAWGRVTDTRRAQHYGLVELDIGLVNEAGLESTPGKAVVALPYRGGPAVPYPFVPPQED